MTRQSISIDGELLEVLKKKAEENDRSLSKEIAYRLKLTLRQEDEKEKDKREGSAMTWYIFKNEKPEAATSGSKLDRAVTR